MNTWTVQKGYPVLNLSKNGDKYVVTQERFLTDQSAVETEVSPYNYKWEVPVTYLTSADSTRQQKWLHMDQDSLEM